MRSAFPSTRSVPLLLLACGLALVNARPSAAASAAIEVVVNLRFSTPTISVAPTSFSLRQEVGDPPQSVPFSVRNAKADGTLMYYTLTAPPDWLSCAPTAGISTGDPQPHTLFVDPSNLTPGDYAGRITITAPGAGNSPLVVPVSLRVDPVIPPDLPNLAIADFDFSPQDVSPDGGTSITFAGRIINNGACATTDTFWIEFCVWRELPPQPGRIFLTDTWLAATLLAPGESIDLVSIVLPTNPLAPGAYYVGIVVDSSDVIAEEDETDNAAWVTGKKLYVGPRQTGARAWRLYE